MINVILLAMINVILLTMINAILLMVISMQHIEHLANGEVV